MISPLALAHNEDIKKTNLSVYNMLSELGKSLYFPKGIITQSSEAAKLATKFNATIGIATNGKDPLSLPTARAFFNQVSNSEAFNYSPSEGKLSLREAWQKRIIKNTPDLNGTEISLPISTNGITHGLSTCANLFVEPGDSVVLPDQIWENYRLTFALKRGAIIHQHPYFKDNAFDTDSFAETVGAISATSKKVIVILNSPNNPTGYAFTEADILGIERTLLAVAERGTNVVAICDDAYYGLFFEPEVYTQSIFGKLANLHPNVLAIKLDGVTKEFFAWGFRVAFITYGNKIGNRSFYESLEKKTSGDIRGTTSSGPSITQAIAEKMLNSESIDAEVKENNKTLKERANKIREILSTGKYADKFKPYPFNAGYFMLLKLNQKSAEKMRVHLLEKYNVGTIATAEYDLRVAFSCVKVEDIPELFDILYRAASEI